MNDELGECAWCGTEGLVGYLTIYHTVLPAPYTNGEHTVCVECESKLEATGTMTVVLG